MDHFPIFLSTAGQRVVLAGGGDAALAKLRLLMKTRARLFVYAANPDAAIRNWAEAGKLTLIGVSAFCYGMLVVALFALVRMAL